MSGLQNQYVISIMSRDRVGIIYEVSKAISELQGDIAEVRDFSNGITVGSCVLGDFVPYTTPRT